MLVSLNGTYYHYCRIDAGTVSSLLSADSMGRYYANSGQRRRSSKLTARQQGFTGDSAALEADVTRRTYGCTSPRTHSLA